MPRTAASAALLGATATLRPGNRGTQMAQPAVRPALLGATATLRPGHRGTETATG